MQLPKFVLADNSDFPEDIFVIHLDFPRFIINLKDDEVEFLEDLENTSNYFDPNIFYLISLITIKKLYSNFLRDFS